MRVAFAASLTTRRSQRKWRQRRDMPNLPTRSRHWSKHRLLHFGWSACVQLAQARASTLVISLPSMRPTVRSKWQRVIIEKYSATVSILDHLQRHSVATRKGRSSTCWKEAMRLFGSRALRSSQTQESLSQFTPMPLIVGSPRSGTTLLRLMLDSHSELTIPPETGLLVLGPKLLSLIHI